MNKKKKGFTIVELVVVIAVIGILSAILIPTFSGLIKKSQYRGQQLELRNAYEAYAIEAGEDVLTEKDVVLAKVATKTAITGDVKAYKLDEHGVWQEVEAADLAHVADYPVNDVVGGTQEAPTHTAQDYNGYYVFKYTPAA